MLSNTHMNLPALKSSPQRWLPRVERCPIVFPERSLLWTCPDSTQDAVYSSARDGGPTLLDEYGPSPAQFVVSVIRYGPSAVTTSAITTITNKGVISALLLTFNYGAVSSAAQEPDTSHLFRLYFFCQMTAVVLAFCVMISASTYVSHISRSGQSALTLISYMRAAKWIDSFVTEPSFVAQCLFTLLALVINVSLTYNRSLMLYLFIGMVAACSLLLLVVHKFSERVQRRIARNEWQDLVAAEEEFRSWAQLRWRTDCSMPATENGGGGEATDGSHANPMSMYADAGVEPRGGGETARGGATGCQGRGDCAIAAGKSGESIEFVAAVGR